MKIIDAHIHCCSSPYFNQIAEEAAHVNTTEHLRTVFQEEGIVQDVYKRQSCAVEGRWLYMGLSGEIPFCPPFFTGSGGT